MTNLDNKSFMKTQIYFFFLLISFTIGCSQQKNIMVIPGSEINILRSTILEEGCKKELHVFTNMDDYNTFQLSLVKPGQRNPPLNIIDFSTKNVAVICKQNIGNYHISEINSISKKNTLKLILNEDQDLTNTDNLLIIEIPKKIVYLTLEL